MQSVLRKSTVSVSCKASPKVNGNNRKFMQRAQDTVKEFGKKRNTVAKENLNKLVSVSQQEVQELSELFKELDVLHKAQFDELKTAFKASWTKAQGEEKEQGDEVVAVTEVVEPIVDETNIFVDK